MPLLIRCSHVEGSLVCVHSFKIEDRPDEHKCLLCGGMIVSAFAAPIIFGNKVLDGSVKDNYTTDRSSLRNIISCLPTKMNNRFWEFERNCVPLLRCLVLLQDLNLLLESGNPTFCPSMRGRRDTRLGERCRTRARLTRY